ncbi:MAG: sigma-54-dependent Fis family transcriptional regulator [Myxococcales bacterium]
MSEWRPRVLVVEDDASLRTVLRFNLEEEGYDVTLLERGDAALSHLTALREPYDLVITDVKMPGADGNAVLAAARRLHPKTQVIVMTAFGTVEQAVAAMEAGAVDYVTKPFRRAELKARIARVMDRAALERENQALRAQVMEGAEIVTASPRMQEVLRVAERVAAADATVLLEGESGTGKELVARLLHARSARAGGPLVPVNCAALPRELLESELFGHERGAFTGAARAHQGKFERASGGTLFLDEIGELPIELQAKILRVLEEGIVDRVGSSQRVSVDVRIVAATNRDLRREVQAGHFREDLYHRLSVVPIALPPLRERPEDVPLLVSHFIRQSREGAGVTVAPALLAEMQRRRWPGNVRELKNTVARMLLLRRGDVLDLADLATPGGSPAPAETPAGVLTPGRLVLPETPFSLPDLEREVILKALERHGGNQSATARYLGIPRHVLLYRLEKFGAS